MTDMRADEILTEIHVKPCPANAGSAYCKLKRKTGDFATAAAAVALEMSGGVVSSARIALTNVAPTALDAHAAAAALVGQPLTEATLKAAADAAMAICDPAEDLRGDIAYKTAMAGEMTKRAIRLAASRCK